MGTQQLLLLILGVIIVGIMIAVAIVMFHDNAVNSNRDALTNDLMEFASRAQKYYHQIPSIGGGGGSFANITLGRLTNDVKNENGSYSIISVAAQEIVLAGRGLYLVGTDSVEVHCTVRSMSYTFSNVH